VVTWRPFVLGSLLATACIGEPELFDCEERPELPGCGTSGGETTGTSSATAPTTESSTTDDDESSSTGEGQLPPAGICYRELSPLQWDMGSGEATVSNGLFEMVFAADENYMPSRLAAVEESQENLLYTGGAEERLMGVQLWQTSWSHGSGTATPMELVAWERGGAVVRLSVQWSAPKDSLYIQSGYPTRYTITPDGRMTRLEAVLVLGTPEPLQWLNAYVALNRARFDAVEVRGEGIFRTEDLEMQGMFYPDMNPEDDANLEPVLLCAYDVESGIAVGLGADPWPSQSDNGTHPKNATYAWGLRGSHPVPESIGLQLDWGRNFQPDSTVYHTHFMTMITVGPAGDPCGCMHEQFRAYVQPPAMEVVGGMLVNEIEETQEDPQDTVPDGYFSDGGYYAIRANESPAVVRMTDTELPTALLRVTGVGNVAADGFTARMDGIHLADGVDYLATPSNDPAQGFYFFLARALPPGIDLEIGWDAR
jgi:hypothetical protein